VTNCGETVLRSPPREGALIGSVLMSLTPSSLETLSGDQQRQDGAAGQAAAQAARAGLARAHLLAGEEASIGIK